MTDREPPRAMDTLAGLPLFAHVDRDGNVMGIENCANDAERGEAPSLDPSPRGDRLLPLYGEDTPFDLVTEVRSPPAYHVEADRVTRTYTVRAKTAAELLREISWWFAALNGSGVEIPGMSAAAVNDSAGRMMAAVGEHREPAKER